MAFQLRRGTNAQRSTITPLQGELLYTTDTKNLYVGDGTTAGGVIVSGGGGGGETYGISAETATGGANLRLTGSDASTDNVKLAEGANVTITRTDANTITISSTGTGGASDLNDLGDVVISGTPSSGQVLKYDSGLGAWVNGADSTSTDIFLDDLSDVVITGTPTEGDVLTWNNSLALWVNGTGAPTYTDQEATDAMGLAFGNGIHTGITFNYAPLTQSISATVSLDPVGTMLEDGVNTGITFSYNPATDTLTSTVAVALGDVTDVALDTPAIGDILRYNGSVWTESSETVWTLLDDTTPQLSGDLDLNAKRITGTGGVDITGDVIATGDIITTAGSLSVVSETINASPNILDVVSYNDAANIRPLFNLYKARGTQAAPAAAQLNDVIGGMRFVGQGTNTGVFTIQASAAIQGHVDPTGTVAAAYAPGSVVIYTRNNAGTLNASLTVDKDGYLKVLDATTVLPAAVDEVTGAVKYLTIKIGSSNYYIPLLNAI
jgi:hypothetical protein